MRLRKKLIEVALPLDAINKASAREKSIRHGHPSTLHLWWARRPLAAARAVIFSQMVDDPSEYVDTLKSDANLKRKAETEFRKRHKVWEQQTEDLRRAKEAKIEAPDPGPEPNLDEIIAEQERDRLFKIIEELVLWENTTNEEVLDKARAEIWQSWRRTCADNADHPRAAELFDRNKLPAFHDPFAGGGALPLEAQRLGLEAYASDLNPVAVLINKAMIEIPPKFAGREPVNPEWQSKSPAEKALHGPWKGAQGLAEDVRYYGKWMRDEAEKRIGHLYPKVKITDEMIAERPDLKQYRGKELTVIAWIWARTVKSPNPAFRDVDVPLASTFMLSTKPGKEAYVEPVIENGGYRFQVKRGKPNNLELARSGTKTARGANFNCLLSNTPISGDYVKSEGTEKRLGSRLMAIVVDSDKGREYLSPSTSDELVAKSARPHWLPETALPDDPRNFWTVHYGLVKYADLYTPRQLTALSSLSSIVTEVVQNVRAATLEAGGSNDDLGLENSGSGGRAYAEAVGLYLAFLVDQQTNQSSTICGWNNINQQMIVTFSRQSLPMVWDYAECNILSQSSGSFWNLLDRQVKGIYGLSNNGVAGFAHQADAAFQEMSRGRIIATDPPYYDNIAYADLSDYFYVWLRHTYKNVFPQLLSTIEVPKREELVASPYRHNGKHEAEKFFLEGMTNAMNRLANLSHPLFPVSVFYAFKQAEKEDAKGLSSTGWETFLGAMLESGFSITGTWPIKTESANKLKANVSALASSIVLVSRKRPENAPTVTRREFVNALKAELPEALRHLQRGNIAPVDLAQAAIGPGMAVFTRYEKVLDAEGNKLTVREALALINQTLDEVLAEQEGDFDADSRWALTWFEQFGFEEGEYGVAETLSKSKNTSVAEMADQRNGGIIESKAGRVRLKRPAELSEEWDPATDPRLTVWEMTHHLIRVLEKDGETAAAQIVAKLGARAETARELCYRLYTMCERKKRAQEALSYNGLVQSWPEIMRLAQQQTASTGGEEVRLPGVEK